MAGAATVRIVATITGLDDQVDTHVLSTMSATPTKRVEIIQVQTTADIAEALNLGGITTPKLIIIEAIGEDLQIDTSYVSSFVAEQTLAEGEAAVIGEPGGSVYIKNDEVGKTATVRVILVGT